MMSSKKDSKLNKLQMPKKRQDDMEMDDMLAAEDEGSPEEEASESPEEEAQEDDMGAEKASPLADVSDDDLLAEIKKRGLSSELEGEAKAEDDYSLMA